MKKPKGRIPEAALTNAWFTLNHRELEDLGAWIAGHSSKCRSKKKTAKIIISGNNGIGQGLTLKCACGEEVDLTDYDSW